MSAFGDNTPKQEIYEGLKMIKIEKSLSWYEFLRLLSEVFSYLVDEAMYEEQMENKE